MALVLFAARGAAGAEAAPALKWLPWSDQVFEQAKKENRFVLLNLHAVWCHWCHVMEEKTYRDPEVIALLQKKYLLVEVDADGRPDLANRYEDYGWPATIVFGPEGGEIVKRRGFLPPGEMASLLQAIIDDPSPGPSVRPEKAITYATEAALPAKLRAKFEEAIRGAYDHKEGSWGEGQKFLDWDNTEWCLSRAIAGDAEAAKMARQTLKAQRGLLDPVWGGVYQYSTDGDWVHPHFEKLIQFQSENMRIYSLAYALWGEPMYAETARAIWGYVQGFLMSPEGAFYVSQNADLIDGEHAEGYFKLDDTGRRKLGLPRVDRHIYARENGWMIQALVALHRATGDAAALDAARRAADWVVKHRWLTGGGFRHEEKDAAGPFLGDSLTMGRALLDLYSVTGEMAYLQRAEEAAGFIAKHFARDLKAQAGLVSADVTRAMAPSPKAQYDENVGCARFANLLFRYTGKVEYRALAECAMRWLATPEIGEERPAGTGGLLLAAAELSSDPLHLTIVGGRKEAAARELFATALRAGTQYKVTEWLDPAGEKLPYQELEFPKLAEPAAFVCANGACSKPIKEVAGLEKKLPRAR